MPSDPVGDARRTELLYAAGIDPSIPPDTPLPEMTASQLSSVMGIPRHVLRGDERSHNYASAVDEQRMIFDMFSRLREKIRGQQGKAASQQQGGEAQ